MKTARPPAATAPAGDPARKTRPALAAPPDPDGAGIPFAMATRPPPDGGPLLRPGDVVQRYPDVRYTVTVPWDHVENQVVRHSRAGSGLDLDPEWQREHVWTREQQVRYIEHILSGGRVARELTFVCASWEPRRAYAILDGKQRLESVRAFLRGEFRVLPDARRTNGYAAQDFAGDFFAFDCEVVWNVVVVPRHSDVLRLYLAINENGTPHSPAALDRVRLLLARETLTEHIEAGSKRRR